MPPFPKPGFEYEYQVQAQIDALREYEATEPGRGIPDKAADRLLLATWNIANLGRAGQDRRAKDFMLIAELISWFDLVAVQEVNDDLSGLRGVQQFLPGSYRLRIAPATRSGSRSFTTAIASSCWRRSARLPSRPLIART